MASKPDWTAIGAALKTWAEGAALRINGTAVPVQWEHDQGGLHIGGGLWIELNVRSIVSVGTDEVRYAYDSPYAYGEELTPTVTGQRTFVVSIKVPSNVQTIGALANSRMLLEGLRTALRWPSAFAAFDAVGCGFIKVLRQMDEVPDPRSKRDRSYAVLEAIFIAAAAIDDVPTTYIEQVQFSGSVAFPTETVTVQERTIG